MSKIENWITEVEPANETQGPLYRLHETADSLATYEFKGCTTLKGLFENSVKKFGDEPCLGQRYNDGPFQWMTYSEVMDAATKINSALISEGVEVGTLRNR